MTQPHTTRWSACSDVRTSVDRLIINTQLIVLLSWASCVIQVHRQGACFTPSNKKYITCYRSAPPLGSGRVNRTVLRERSRSHSLNVLGAFETVRSQLRGGGMLFLLLFSSVFIIPAGRAGVPGAYSCLAALARSLG